MIIRHIDGRLLYADYQDGVYRVGGHMFTLSMLHALDYEVVKEESE